MEYKEYLKSNLWKNLRLKAYKRSKNKCEFCGNKASAVHHIKYPKNFSKDSLDNLLVVCDKHHKLSHGIRKIDWRDMLMYCIQKGFLIERELLELFDDMSLDKEKFIEIMNKIKTKYPNKRIFTLKMVIKLR